MNLKRGPINGTVIVGAVMTAFEVIGDLFMPVSGRDAKEAAASDIIDACSFIAAAGAIRFDVSKTEFLRRAGELWDEAVSETRQADAEIDS